MFARVLRLSGGFVVMGGTAPYTVVVTFFLTTSVHHRDLHSFPTRRSSDLPTITGSRGGNAALADLLTELDTMGLITDSSS